MKCPYCNEEMEKGLITSPEPINFMKESRFVNQPKENKGEFNLAKPPFGGRATVEVWLCRNCKKILIEY